MNSNPPNATRRFIPVTQTNNKTIVACTALRAYYKPASQDT